jgi:hypothetical protein
VIAYRAMLDAMEIHEVRLVRSPGKLARVGMSCLLRAR